MKNVFLTDYILYSLARALSLILTALPVRAALGIGRFFGTLAYFLNHKRAKVAYSNMRAAFSAEKDPCEIRSTVRLLYRNFGQVLVEVLRIPTVDKAYIERYVTVENMPYIRQALAKGHGLIFLTAHFGNWELSSITSAFKGFPLLVLAREQKMKRLNGALNALRESKGCRVVKKGMATREIYEHLGGNGIVGILSDQDAGKKAVFVNFFGRPTSMARGAFALSQKTGAAIIPTFMVRTEGPYHRLMLEKPVSVAAGEEGELEAMQRFASALEKHIRRSPEQWLWVHKRWKSTTLRKAAVLNDGKAGHLNQSLAIFEKIKEARREAGYGDSDTQLKIIDVEYKTKAHRNALAVLSNFIADYPLLRMPCLKLCLTEDSYRRLKESYADITVSCGAAALPVNLLFSRENNAKSVVLMKPALIASKKFDLAIIPEHDNPPRDKNIVTTFGAPNLITERRLEGDLRSLEKMVDLKGRRNIGLFIGGENKQYTLDTVLLKSVLENIIGAAEELGMNLLVTTSRRTKNDIGEFLRRELRDKDLTKLLVLANERNPEWTVGGILAASDVVVVSGESNSMLSEAASSGKHVVVFRPKRRAGAGKDDKHEFFLSMLDREGFAHTSEVADLKKHIIKLANSRQKPKKLNDNKKVLEAVKRII